MRIGIDIDDTIADTTNSVIEYAIKFDKEFASGKGIVDSSKDIPNCFDWNEDETKLFFDKVFNNIVLDIPPKQNVKRALKKIREAGNKIIIITSRSHNHMIEPYEKTKKWLEINSIPFDKLIVGIKYKGPIVENEKIDIFIDDSVGQCTYIVDNYDKVDVIILNKGTNKTNNNKIIRAENWNEIEEFILNYES